MRNRRRILVLAAIAALLLSRRGGAAQSEGTDQGSMEPAVAVKRATELNQLLPISVSIGVDPAIEVTSCFEPPTTDQKARFVRAPFLEADPKKWLPDFSF